MGLANTTQGEIVIGGYETSRFTGQLSFLPVVTYGSTGKANLGETGSAENGVNKYWTIPGQAIAAYDVNGTQVYETRLDQLEPVILDTGTTLSYLPQAMVTSLLDLVTTNYTALALNSGTIQAYQVNCQDFTRQHLWFDFQFSPSTLTFSNDPVKIRVPLNEMVLPQDTNTMETATTCLFGIAPISTSFLNSVGSGWILGQTVLRSAYVVHDMLGLQVGIGAAANGYHSPTMDGEESNGVCVTPITNHHD
ncbi:aspartic peptidase domain-containing protein [Mucor mucedo]|uniref:aspartic peptidase domain-containing protein n=1 Tax=Mucor mucedo TaxID=29922 RepID=UPI00221EAF39|nr:aspartic peptidase domain-containing protein [Mucor mucedo]KAI7897324.1 aspartic peptidase domain-containing protein [Mucor mucedo]